MIKLMKYLKKSAGYIVLIIALLFLQAYCDLSLPDYTSKIINVGIQQKGIEDSVPDKLRDSTLQNLQIFMDEDQKKEVSQNYTQEDDTWVLNDDISKETRENLNEDFSKAMMMVSAFSEDSEQGQAMAAQMGLPEGTDPLTALTQMPEKAVQQIMSQVDEKLKYNIRFKRHNLMEAPPGPEKFDLILCRNVMIYFDRMSREKLIRQLEYCLNPGGYLLVGHAELLSREETRLETVFPAVYKKPAKQDGDRGGLYG